jgi:phenylacetate-CoA ligase
MTVMPEVLLRIREHPDAPRWNTVAGDGLQVGDLETLDRFRHELATRRGPRAPGPPPPPILQRVAAWLRTVPWLRQHVTGDPDLERDWPRLPTMSRLDLALHTVELVPDGVALDRLIVYRTAGTTGHPLMVPHHPRAAASYLPLLEVALARHGVESDFGSTDVACFLLGAQARTVTYPCVLTAWSGAGFAKLNLRQAEWPREGSQARFIGELAAKILTGDPISFAEMLRLGVLARPRALVSTAVAMSAGLRRRLTDACDCPVIDWYSLTETGPIGYLCPRGDAYHVLPHDLHVEVLDEDGLPVSDGARGEVAVTGGRNPFLPLVRYRTGDFGRLAFEPCPCGEETPRLLDLEGRKPVLFRAADNSSVNAVDLARALRELPLVQHRFTQRADSSCELVVRPVPGNPVSAEVLREALRRCLGTLPVEVRFDEHLGDRDEGKVAAWSSELLLED